MNFSQPNSSNEPAGSVTSGSRGASDTIDLTASPDPKVHAADPAALAAALSSSVEGAQRDLSRDLSWLEFNRRVLDQAEDKRLPLLERVKFLAIFSSNLDEFFMKRIALLQVRVERDPESADRQGRLQREVLSAARTLVLALQQRQAMVWNEDVLPALAQAGIHIVSSDQLNPEELKLLDDRFLAEVFPVLTPLAVDPGHRFPFISNLSENLGLFVGPPGDHALADRRFARIKIPDVLPRFIEVPTQGQDRRFIGLEEVIKRNLYRLFPGMETSDITAFRITRSTGLQSEEDDVDDLLEHVETELRKRRFSDTVRLELPEQHPESVRRVVAVQLGLTDNEIYSRPGPLEYSDLFQLTDIDRPDLKHKPWTPIVPPRLAHDDADIFSVIRERDLLLHHPYESFQHSVQHFIAAAAKDPDVLAIKLTLYRTSRDSPFVTSLIRAAEAGKQVACLVELRARFDESKNVRFARQLEKHGVHVAYGVVGLKTHCKCSLVVRRERDSLRCYAHIGTGNYHPHTAQLYTDLGLLTCHPQITLDTLNLFNLLTGRGQTDDFSHLLIAPTTMRNRYLEMIDREIANAKAGKPARIIAKMNALEDQPIIDRLYKASRAGVRIELYVRGFCCLRPGVPGQSENIIVKSVVGRFLEHSRVFHFADGHEDPRAGLWYISSADWMSRNLTGRVEAAVPVVDHAAREQLHTLIDFLQRDRTRAWSLNADGTYTKLSPAADDPEGGPERLGTFVTLMNHAEARRAPTS